MEEECGAAPPHEVLVVLVSTQVVTKCSRKTMDKETRVISGSLFRGFTWFCGLEAALRWCGKPGRVFPGGQEVNREIARDPIFPSGGYPETEILSNRPHFLKGSSLLTSTAYWVTKP